MKKALITRRAAVMLMEADLRARGYEAAEIKDTVAQELEWMARWRTETETEKVEAVKVVYLLKLHLFVVDWQGDWYLYEMEEEAPNAE